MGAVLLVYAGWQLLRWPHGHRTLIGDMFFYPVSTAAIASAWAASRRCAGQPRLRSAWRLLALAAASYLVADVAQTIYELAGQKPYPSVADGFYLLFCPLMLAGVLRFAAGRQTLSARVRLALDMTAVAIGGSVVVIYVVLGPTVVQGGSDPVQTAFSIAYPVGDMVLLVGLGSVLLRRTPASSGRALQFVAAGLLFYVAGDLVYGYITLHGTYHGGDPVDSLWIVAIAVWAVAGAAQARSDPGSDLPVDRERSRASWAPFVGVAAGFGLLLFDHRHDRLLPNLTLVICAVALATLVSARQFLAQRDLVRTQGQLTYLSLHDALTGLPNRALVIDRTEQMLARARRHGAPIAALYVDLDGFKAVNDRFGHAAGDVVLRVIATRLMDSVREADTVGRLGGDEFVVLLDELQLDSGAELVAGRICEALGQPVQLGETEARTVSVTASVGIALGQRACADELLRDADFALYEAKAGGKNRFVVFESHKQAAAQDQMKLELDLRGALAGEQLFLVYQPTFDLRSETIVGVEALIRWRHPTRGIIAPNDFIPLAEDTGMIVPIGRWVLETACRQGAAWRGQGHALRISVNVSARQLDDDELVEHVARTLADTGLDPGALTLEMTETVLVRDAEIAARKLTELKAQGVRIAIDDFGTGYSSLAYLRQFPVDALKIDRSFIASIGSSGESRALIHTLVQLAKILGLETVGEGIEDHAQLRHLQGEHCDQGQGFLLARPLEPGAIDELLRANAATAV